jgi:mono/diheme cytochrome c family protein
VRTKVGEGIYPPLPAQPYVKEFPFPVTEEVLDRGRQGFTVFCVPCHDPLGEGKGIVVDRGFTAPPSYHNKRLREAPVGYLFGVASHGVGSMPDYSMQILPEQRWEIVAYLRALQLSQNARIEDLPADQRKAAEEHLKTANRDKGRAP